MSPSRPFFDPETGELDTVPLIEEAIPLARLIGAIVLVALVPILFRVVFNGLLGLTSGLGFLYMLASQFILAIGTGLVLLYVIVRANQIIDE
ncbi:hypothetical protein [Natrinema sp. DC36]|uniref:hypothetical protein n=1 Tax=Natrinema sp. DC36 TaxID=2878680 RepID=UPI001CF07EB7|nr:hypothetical protein [Natrinema sp. DC36]